MVLKGLPYPEKVLIAWAEAIVGNVKIRDWLTQNGYPELGIFCFALRNKNDAREWLMKNGHPHLFALINGVERNANALKWLKVHRYEVLFRMALAADGNEESFQWLLHNNYKIPAFIAKKIEYIKDEIEENNNDPHRISFD